MAEHTFDGIKNFFTLGHPQRLNCHQRSQFQAQRILGYLCSTGKTALRNVPDLYVVNMLTNMSFMYVACGESGKPFSVQRWVELTTNHFLTLGRFAWNPNDLDKRCRGFLDLCKIKQEGKESWFNWDVWLSYISSENDYICQWIIFKQVLYLFVDHGWKKPVFPEHVKRVDRDNHTGTNKSGACQVWNPGHHSCSSKRHFWWTGKKKSFIFCHTVVQTGLFRLSVWDDKLDKGDRKHV